MTDPLITLLGPWSGELTPGGALLRILLSIVLSAVLGCERSGKRHSAGLRTFIIVSLACTLAMMLDLRLNSSLYVLSAASVIGLAIITVNSLHFSSRNQIKGLTTSAALWACGLLGLTAGAGWYTVTLVSFAALLCSLSLFPAFEAYLKNRSNHFEVHLELTKGCYLQDFVTTIRRLGLSIDDIESNPAYVGSGLAVYSVAMSVKSKELKQYKTHKEIIEALSTLDYVYHIEEMHT